MVDVDRVEGKITLKKQNKLTYEKLSFTFSIEYYKTSPFYDSTSGMSSGQYGFGTNL